MDSTAQTPLRDSEIINELLSRLTQGFGSDAVFAADAEIDSDAVFAADFSMNSDAELGGRGKTGFR